MPVAPNAADITATTQPAPAPVKAAESAAEPGKAAAVGTPEQSKNATPDQPPVATPDDDVPMPLGKPAALARFEAAKSAPIAVFVSRRESKIYVRQNFAPLFDAPITIQQSQQPLGTHVFTALDYVDGGTTFRWNVISLPSESRAARSEERTSERHGNGRHKVSVAEPVADPQPPESPAHALARLEIPEDIIRHISELMMPGSSLVISDQGLGPETGLGTDFIVVTR